MAACSFNWKLTVTVIFTGTGTPFRSVGVKTHCLTASTAASSSSGFERSTRASFTRPSTPMIASMMTIPSMRACWAIEG